jgi:hypothetical protein
MKVEFEITPEMIEAGANVIWSLFSDVLSPGSESGREAAIEVFRAMKGLSRSEASQHTKPIFRGVIDTI